MRTRKPLTFETIPGFLVERPALRESMSFVFFLVVLMSPQKQTALAYGTKIGPATETNPIGPEAPRARLCWGAQSLRAIAQEHCPNPSTPT